MWSPTAEGNVHARADYIVFQGGLKVFHNYHKEGSRCFKGPALPPQTREPSLTNG